MINLYLENNNILNNFFKEVLLFNIEQIIILRCRGIFENIQRQYSGIY